MCDDDDTPSTSFTGNHQHMYVNAIQTMYVHAWFGNIDAGPFQPIETTNALCVRHRIDVIMARIPKQITQNSFNFLENNQIE